jgi:hypothetical protein
LKRSNSRKSKNLSPSFPPAISADQKLSSDEGSIHSCSSGNSINSKSSKKSLHNDFDNGTKIKKKKYPPKLFQTLI